MQRKCMDPSLHNVAMRDQPRCLCSLLSTRSFLEIAWRVQSGLGYSAIPGKGLRATGNVTDVLEFGFMGLGPGGELRRAMT